MLLGNQQKHPLSQALEGFYRACKLRFGGFGFSIVWGLRLGVAAAIGLELILSLKIRILEDISGHMLKFGPRAKHDPRKDQRGRR